MHLNEINTVVGVELNIINENLFSCRFCVVSRVKNSLNIDLSKTIKGTLSVVLESLPKTYPISLSLTGKGLIHKNIQITGDLTPSQVFQNSFPSIEEKEFYLQIFNQNENALISAIRRPFVNELLDKMERAGLKILMLALGGIISVPILPQLNIYAEEIHFDGHVFNLNPEKEFTLYKQVEILKSDYPTKIGLEIISEQNIIAYASAFQLLLHKKIPLIRANVDSINHGFLSFIENNRLKKMATLFLFGLLGTLFISYVLFSYYNDNNAALSQKLGALTSNADQVDMLRKNNAKNELLLKQLNWNKGYSYGFLLNEVGESMPKQLQLLEITMNEFKLELEKSTRSPLIKISGVTDNLTAVNNWIFELKQKPWVKSVRLLKYEEDAESEKYKFSLILTY